VSRGQRVGQLAINPPGVFVLGEQRQIFGPHMNPNEQPMRMFVNYVPTAALHVQKSSFCATCHTVITRALDANGKPVAAGTYSMSVAVGTTTSTVNAQWHASVDAVELTPDGPRLRMRDVLLAPGDIRTIGSSIIKGGK